jgi:ribosomal-protein-serine acetyltransferase
MSSSRQFITPEAMMHISHDLDTLLAQSMLDKDALAHLVEATRCNLMPFGETRKNQILAVIRQLHARNRPVDIVTVYETIEQNHINVHLDDLAAMVNAPLVIPLIAEGMIIRPFSQKDIGSFVSAIHESMATVGAWLPWFHADYSEIDAVGWFSICKDNIASGEAYDLGIFSADDQHLLGGVAINQINRAHKIGNLGYWVRESQQRQGFATRAINRIADFGFKELRLNRLEFAVAEENLASRRVAEKAGALFECVAQGRLIVHGIPRAAAIYSIVAGTRCTGDASL